MGDDAGGDSGPVASAVVHFYGRFDARDPTLPACSWTYCGFGVRFSGTGVDVELSGAGGIGFQTLVDGMPAERFVTDGGEWTWQESATVYAAAEGLAPGEHFVEVRREPEGMFGETRFHAFVPAAGGELLPSPPRFARRLEVIGDSISAGYGNTGCPFSAATEDGFAVYGPVAARALDADIHVEAYSGRGLARNYDGSTDGLLPELYGLAIPEDDTSIWDHGAWTPDAVVVNLGTNDFNAGVDPGVYVTAYVGFVNRLRGYFPNALILCAVNGAGDAFSTPIDQVLTAVGDARVQKINLDSPNWSGCDGHPNVVADQAMAGVLVARLQQELGW
jgi:lysophospholipase L1-like esterase